MNGSTAIFQKTRSTGKVNPEEHVVLLVISAELQRKDVEEH